MMNPWRLGCFLVLGLMLAVRPAWSAAPESPGSGAGRGDLDPDVIPRRPRPHRLRPFPVPRPFPGRPLRYRA